MKKLVCVLIVLMILCMGVTAYAEEAAPDTVITTEAVTSAPITAEEDLNEKEPMNLGKWLWDTITTYALEILATLSLTATAAGVLLNKKQLFPKIANFMKVVGEFLSGQKDEISVWKEKSETVLKEYREETKKALEESRKELQRYSEIVTDVLMTVKGLAEEVIRNGQTNEIVLRCLYDQEETLNTVIQSSTMAQWKKDIEGQRHAAHAAAIADMLSAKDDTEDKTEGGEST